MLQDNLKTAVVHRDVQGLSNEEAAQILEISVSSLKARLHRGRILLRQHLQEYLAANKEK
jgi:DNA-directed RNA polymerase specialized sigma24 family protein